VKSVTSGSNSLKDAMNEALRDWVANVEDTFYIIGTVAGPHPYPAMVRDFQSVIGRETREQMMEAEGRLPDSLVACIGGGSNAMGLFHPFLDEPDIKIIGVEAAGHGVDTDKHAASLTGGRPGVLHGNRTYLRSRPASITPASDPNIPGCMKRAASNMSRPPTSRRWRPFSSAAVTRASSRRWNPLTRWRMWQRSRATCPATISSA
jgi:hypothetical protein